MPVFQEAIFGERQKISVKAKRPPKPKDFTGQTCVAEVLLLGAGTQSMVILAMCWLGILPKPRLVIFCDTGVEPFWVWRQVRLARRLCEEMDVRMIVTALAPNVCLEHETFSRHPISRCSIPVWLEPDQPGGRPGRLRRQCTVEYKIKPNQRILKLWLVKHGYGHFTVPYNPKYSPLRYPTQDPPFKMDKSLYVRMWYGFPKDEQARANPNRGLSWQATYHPLIDLGMTSADVHQWWRTEMMDKRGYAQIHSSSCWMCPNRTDSKWLEMQTLDPCGWEWACQFDERIRRVHWREEVSGVRKDTHWYATIRKAMYLHESCQPLREIDFAARVEARRQRKIGELNMFEWEAVEEGCKADGGFSCAT